MGIPVAIELAIWLNQVRNGAISSTDAVNALETITGQTGLVDLTADSKINNWFDLVTLVEESLQPIIGVSPTPGNTYGLPADLIANLDFSFGACVIANQLVLGYSTTPDQKWMLSRLAHSIPNLDPKSVRINVTQMLENSAATLSSLHLIGDRTLVEQQLAKLNPVYLPPSLSNRVRNDLELARRVLLICQIGVEQAQAVHSRSSDLRKQEELNKLKNAALDLLVISSFSN